MKRTCDCTSFDLFQDTEMEKTGGQVALIERKEEINVLKYF